MEPVKEYSHCIDCHRKLKNPKFRQIGRGDVCQRKHENKQNRGGYQLELRIELGVLQA